MKKKILVIGSAGYIGSVLIKNLKQKLNLNEYQILGVDTNWYSKNLEVNKYNSYLPEIMYNYDCRKFNLKNLNINLKPNSETIEINYKPSEIKFNELLKAIYESNIEIKDISIKETKLEDVFLKLTQN